MKKPARAAARPSARRASVRADRTPAARRAAPSRPQGALARLLSRAASRAAALVPGRERPPFLVAFALALAAACCILPRLSPPAPTLLWRGYHTLAVRADVARAGKAGAIAAVFGPGVISEAGAAAEYWDFSGLSRIPFAELDERLDPSDPRRDPYIDGAQRYFVASGATVQWELLYIPSSAPGGLTFLRAAGALGLPWHGEWRLIDFDPLQKALSACALLGFCVLLALSNERRRRASVALALIEAVLWVPLALSGGLAELSLALILILAWFPLLRVSLLVREWDLRMVGQLKRPILLFGLLAIGGTCLVGALKGYSAASVFAVLLPAASSLALLPVLPGLFAKASVRRSARVVFEPVPIVRPSLEAFRGRPAAAIFAVLALAALAVLAAVRGPAVPTPLAVVGARDFSWRGIERLSSAPRERGLPDAAGFVTHVAFQETMTFGRTWKMPLPDERVYLREFVTDSATGVTTERLRTVKVFDSTWLSSVRERAPAGSLEALLYAQGRPVAVAIRKPWRTEMKDLPMTLLAMCVLLAAAARSMGLAPFRKPIPAPLIRPIDVLFNGAARRRQVQ